MCEIRTHLVAQQLAGLLLGAGGHGHPQPGVAAEVGQHREDAQIAEQEVDAVDEGLLAGLSAVHVAPYPGTALAGMERAGRFRIIEPRMNRWTLSRPIIELLDADGRVSYSAEQMRRVFQAYLDLWRLCRDHDDREAPGADPL